MAQVTKTLQTLIDEAGNRGGIVSVSPGRWEVTTLYLRSNMTFRLERGATLITHPDLDNYPESPEADAPAIRGDYHTLVATGSENLTI